MSLHIVSFAVLLIAMFAGFWSGRTRSLTGAGGDRRGLHSLPNYYGYFVAWAIALPGFLIFFGWLLAEPQIIRSLVMGSLSSETLDRPVEQLGKLYADIRAIAGGDDDLARTASADMLAAAEFYNTLVRRGEIGLLVVMLAVSATAFFAGRSYITPAFRARNAVERMVMGVLIVSSTIAILTTLGIVFSLLFEALRFFERVSPLEFFFGTQWSPQTAIRAEQIGQSGAFGAVPVFTGTIVIMVIAILVAGPIGLFAALYLSEYASKPIRATAKPILELLAGIPTVVYGFFAALTVGPLVADLANSFGQWIGVDLAVPTETAIAAGVVMGVMIIPFIASLSDDVINAVPQSLRDGSYALGATRSETMRKVVFPAALPGIAGAFLLAVSRAIGETMIVVMAAGQAANLTANPFEAVTTVTVQIVILLTGDQEFDSAKTLSSFALGLTLFAVTLILNIIALRIVQKYRERYD